MPSGWIEMDGIRPEINSIASSDGVWINPPAYTPSSCTRRQGRLALLQIGKLDDVEDFIDSIADPMVKRSAQIEYESDTWSSDNVLIHEIWENIGGTHGELIDLFRLAVTL